MTQNVPAYHLKKIQHYYGRSKVLDIKDLKIPKGSITGLVGPNGSGKSTLLKLLGFALEPTQGEIFYNGKKEYCFSPSIRSRVTLLTQTPYLLKRSVFENIIYGLKIRNDKKELKNRVKKALLGVGLEYDDFAHRKWHELSGGEAQRVAMAARLILKPEVLLLDEPIASVDTKSARQIRKASINAQKRWGTTLVIASHDLQWLYSVSDTQLSIFNGQIFTSGIENVIPGPFEKASEKIWKKGTGNGQSFFLKAPEKKSDNAVIKKKHISICVEKKPELSTKIPTGNSPTENILSGHVVSMLLEKKSSHIMTIVSVGDLSFTVRLVPDQVSSFGLHPGKEIYLMFSSDHINWI